MRRITTRALLGCALASAFFAVPAWCQDEPPQKPSESQKPSENVRPQHLDLDVFKSSIQPIFLKERPGHARCYGCHVLSNRAFHLEPLAPGATSWTEEQSRKNFQSVSQLVVPGDPKSSLFLIHPVAPEAGGDAFHSGGRQFSSYDDPDYVTLVEWVRGAASRSKQSSVSSSALVYVTNSAGNTVDVIDTSSNQVVQVIHDIGLPHGVGFSADGSRVYVSTEAEDVLVVVDRQSTAILKKIPLSGRPNNIAVTNDGSLVVVGIRSGDGAVDIIDTRTLTVSKTIPIHGSVHNVFITPDDRYAVTGSIEAKLATVIDLRSEEIAWEIKFDAGVRPMTFEANPDGSTKRIFVQLNDVNGFAVVDFAKHVEVARVLFPKEQAHFGTAEQRLRTPSHGIRVSPDRRALWVNSTLANATYKYSLPDLKLVGFCELPLVYPTNRPATGAVPDWIAITPDSSRLYVSNSATRSVTVIDAATIKPIINIPVGEVPKRLNTLDLGKIK
jgi:YVTN family beta-propeller protein